MSQHMDVVFLLSLEKLLNIKLPRVTRIQLACQMFGRDDLTEKTIDEFLLSEDNEPSTKHWVCYLNERGFTQKKIAEFLNISQPSVSYHIAHPPKKPYWNKGLSMIIKYHTKTETIGL